MAPARPPPAPAAARPAVSERAVSRRGRARIAESAGENSPRAESAVRDDRVGPHGQAPVARPARAGRRQPGHERRARVASVGAHRVRARGAALLASRAHAEHEPAVREEARRGALGVRPREPLGRAAGDGRGPDLGVAPVGALVDARDGERDAAAVRRHRGRADGDDAVDVGGRERALRGGSRRARRCCPAPTRARRPRGRAGRRYRRRRRRGRGAVRTRERGGARRDACDERARAGAPGRPACGLAELSTARRV
jgi:hypothetical protein